MAPTPSHAYETCTTTGALGTTAGRRHALALREPADRRTGRPWRLLWLWLALVVPLSFAGRLLQPVSGVDDRILPLVMVAPGVAWLLCRLMVPGWFPADAPRLPLAHLWRPLVATALASAGFVAGLWALGDGGAPVLPDGPPVIAVGAVVLGLFVGSWCEEVGYRGVMYRAMASRWGAVATVALNGLLFGLGHLQYLGAGPLPVLMFLGFAILLDVVMATTWHGSWQQRVFAATLLHTVLNVAMQLRGIPSGDGSDFAVILGAMTASTLVAVVAGRLLRVGDLRR